MADDVKYLIDSEEILKSLRDSLVDNENHIKSNNSVIISLEAQIQDEERTHQERISLLKTQIKKIQDDTIYFTGANRTVTDYMEKIRQVPKIPSATATNVARDQYVNVPDTEPIEEPIEVDCDVTESVMSSDPRQKKRRL